MINESKYKGFWQDFAIADAFGEAAISDTYNRAFKGWKDNVEYFASLTMTLNHRAWMWYERGNENYTELYSKLWEKADRFGSNHFKGDELAYFLDFLD